MTPSLPDRMRRFLRADVQGMHAYAVQPSAGMVKVDTMENPYGLPPALRRALDPQVAPPGGEPIGPVLAPVGGDDAATHRGSLSGTDVLLVEDNDLNRALVMAILAETGATVR